MGVGSAKRLCKSLVRGEDDWGVSGPQWPRGRPEQCRAQEWGLDEGGRAHRVAQSQWVSCHCAQSWLGEGAGQEASCQTLGQLLLQRQFGLKKTGRGWREARKEHSEATTLLPGKHASQTHGPLCGAICKTTLSKLCFFIKKKKATKYKFAHWCPDLHITT